MKLETTQLEQISKSFDRNTIKSIYKDFIIIYEFITLKQIEKLYYQAEEYSIYSFTDKYIFIDFVLKNIDLFERNPSWLEFALKYNTSARSKMKYIQTCIDCGDGEVIPSKVETSIETFDFDEII